jgi:ADP-heptose:LPS heptosyltransferase
MRFGTYRLRKEIERRVLGGSGVAARRLRHPLPSSAPWRRPLLEVGRDKGLGDILMCTPALRAVKLANPEVKIRFYTGFPSLVCGLPYLDEVVPWTETPPGTIWLGYEDAIPPRVHLARIIGDVLGVAVTDVRPDCVVRPDLVEQYRAAWGDGPNIVVLRRAGAWTPNKDWPMAYWDGLVARLCRDYRVIEIGEPARTVVDALPGRYIDLRGATDLDALVAVVSAADLYVGPDSGPMHIAAAAGRRAVVICGGYDAAVNIIYPTSTILSETPPCAPCWLRTPCPHDLKCLSAISVDAVANAVVTALGSPLTTNSSPAADVAGRR